MNVPDDRRANFSFLGSQCGSECAASVVKFGGLGTGRGTFDWILGIFDGALTPASESFDSDPVCLLSPEFRGKLSGNGIVVFLELGGDGDTHVPSPSQAA